MGLIMNAKEITDNILKILDDNLKTLKVNSVCDFCDDKFISRDEKLCFSEAFLQSKEDKLYIRALIEQELEKHLR